MRAIYFIFLFCACAKGIESSAFIQVNTSLNLNFSQHDINYHGTNQWHYIGGNTGFAGWDATPYIPQNESKSYENTRFSPGFGVKGGYIYAFNQAHAMRVYASIAIAQLYFGVNDDGFNQNFYKASRDSVYMLGFGTEYMLEVFESSAFSFGILAGLGFDKLLAKNNANNFISNQPYINAGFFQRFKEQNLLLELAFKMPFRNILNNSNSYNRNYIYESSTIRREFDNLNEQSTLRLLSLYLALSYTF